MHFTALGFLAGTTGALLLSRLRRGADVHWLWCALPTSLLWTIAALRHPPPHWLALTLALGWLAVLLTATDLLHRRLPDALTLPAYPVAVALLVPAGGQVVLRAAVGGLLLGAAHLVVRLLAPSALGGGDVKLAAPLGAVLGAVSYAAVPIGALLACAFTLLVALARPNGGIPHGPGLLASTWVISVFTL
ncbi:A24 family peptidase [Umezawaea sp. Da 62-37]|uniref:A24 family peptidase n=1 Tax=Umezawaea sp. Da 62-37 TaxID=3075927 RepID=UPI0028F6CC1A|nr:A24 family peptidase [Umezawaea sp. Da 62-37]WNV84179.1 A24 family peptidase [Umezawaea sp. Da 62-37]